MYYYNHLAKFLGLVACGFFGTTVTFAILWLRERERGLRRMIDRAKEHQAAADLEHLVHAVDAIAIEIERVSEGQRFTTQLLAERKPVTPALRQPERVITPH